MTMPGPAIKTRIKQIQGYPTLNDWSRGFCESIVEQIDRGRHLSEKQIEVLTRIFNENTEDAVKALASWPDEYRNSWYANAEILAFYYNTTPYYGRVVNDILSGRVPQKNHFFKMLDNKYAIKVLTEAKKPSKFVIGDYIVANAACSRQDLSAADSGRLSTQVFNDFKRRGGFVIEISSLIVSAAKGAKRYKILPIGSTISFWVEERRLKKAPKPKKS